MLRHAQLLLTHPAPRAAPSALRAASRTKCQQFSLHLRHTQHPLCHAQVAD
ncbi:hypothetical protein A2U01_0061626 [Trifolium medium]|uniref:Uncharacterized protein n=1 Tax=Trifolium medium TaxID=97028 RepID=A0A392RUV2_9FABA|nr:hypothetical protein [Trifolium medium]